MQTDACNGDGSAPTGGAPSHASVHRVLPWVLLALAVGAHALYLYAWFERDHSVARSVGNSLVAGVATALCAVEQGQWSLLSDVGRQGLMAPAAALARPFLGGDPDLLYRVVALCLIGTQVALFDLGRQLAGPLAGVLAAALFPLLPDVGSAVRAWWPLMPQVLLLCIAAGLLLRSRGFSRPGFAAAFAALGGLGIYVSSYPMHNLCYLAPIGAMALGAGISGVVFGRDPVSLERVSRSRGLVGGLLALALLGMALWLGGLPESSLAYADSQLQDPQFSQAAAPGSLAALTAYLRLGFSGSLTPLLAVPFLAALPLWLRGGRGWPVLMCWFVLPLVVFSLIAKKNVYYLGQILPVVPLVIALGLASLRRRWMAGPAAALVLVLAALQYAALFPLGDPHQTLPPWVRVLNLHALPADAQQVFEEPKLVGLEPLPRATVHERAARLVLDAEREGFSQGGSVALDPAVAYLVALEEPCGALDAHPAPLSHADLERLLFQRVERVVVVEPHCGPQAADGADRLTRSPSLERFYEVVAKDLRAVPCVHLYRLRDWLGR